MFLKFFNPMSFFCYNVVYVSKCYSLTFASLVSKTWFDGLPKLSIIGYTLHIKIAVEIFFRFSNKLNAKVCLSFIDKEICGTNIFPIFIKKNRVRIVIAFRSSLFMEIGYI